MCNKFNHSERLLKKQGLKTTMLKKILLFVKVSKYKEDLLSWKWLTKRYLNFLQDCLDIYSEVETMKNLINEDILEDILENN